jgi:hypothetical protein
MPVDGRRSRAQRSPPKRAVGVRAWGGKEETSVANAELPLPVARASMSTTTSPHLRGGKRSKQVPLPPPRSPCSGEAMKMERQPRSLMAAQRLNEYQLVST